MIIHEATFRAFRLVLVFTPLGILLATLLALAAGMGAFRTSISDEEERENRLADKMRNARDFTEICAIFGYAHEEHTVTTPDGYLLLLQRIVPRGGVEANTRRPVVYLQHGLLTNSELFMAMSDAKRCLPLVLLENGYDVWLGNNRGNKYSQRHEKYSSTSSAFWDYSIDDLATSDIPSSISYVLAHTNLPKLSYIGFSQGSAQAFAAFSTNKGLNDKVNVFIALAPILRPRGYSSGILDYILKWNPSFLHTLFGPQALFPIVSTLQRTLPSSFLQLCVDVSVLHLLSFKNHNITNVQKRAAYSHLYCSSSVKSVVHWTQVMKQGQFVKFPSTPTSSSSSNPAVASEFFERYPTEDITTPIVLIHGDGDSLFDLEPALEHLPSSGVRCVELKGYEHLDVLWGANVHVDVIPRVLESLSVPR